MVGFNLIGDRSPFVFFTAVNNIRMGDPLHRAIGRNGDHIEFVDLPEFFGLGHCGSSHAANFVIQFEVIL